MAYTQLKSQSTPGARVEQISEDSSHYLLSVPSGKADKYRLAQLSDYALLPRGRFPHGYGFSLSLSARVSSNSIPGTWGFGLWNDPFGMSLGFGGKPFRVPALPNAVWFFGASKENFLSFKDSRPERSEERTLRRTQSKGDSQKPLRLRSTTSAPPSGTSQRGNAANGFLAQSFRAPRFHPLLALAGLAFPFSRKFTRRLMGRIIDEDGVQLWSQGARSLDAHQQADGVQSVDLTDWHRYKFEWSEKRVLYDVDDVRVFESDVSPNPPLGLVIWIDNQYAAFTPEGKIGFGVLENPKSAWLEVKDIAVIS